MKQLKKTLVILCLFSVMITNAQDIIYKTDGSNIKGKITEINSTSIKYKPVGDKAVSSEINKNDVNYILYQNGTKEYYNTNGSTSKEYVSDSKPEEKKVYGKNIIAVNWFQFFFVNFGMSYERVLASGKFSIKVPFNVSLDGKPVVHNYNTNGVSTDFLQNKIYDVGLELNAYPFGSTRHTFYVGVSGVKGSFHYYTQDPNTVTGYPYYLPISYTRHVGMHYSGLLHIGGNIGLSDNLLLGGKFGIGFKREDIVDTETFTQVRVQLDLNLAYRF
jgi:hypothetical protein